MFTIHRRAWCGSALAVLLAAGVAMSQVPSAAVPPGMMPPGMMPYVKGKLPPRPVSRLLNNGSLYTFPNPNAGLPNQLRYGYIAVAHEDCRLFNNGATLMPRPRMMAAECMNGNGRGPMPPPLPPNPGPLPPNPGPIPPNAVPMPPPGLPPYFMGMYSARYRPWPYAGPSPTMPADAQRPGSASLHTPETVASKRFVGFGTFTVNQFGGFRSILVTEALGDFGAGFEAPADSTAAR